MIETSQVGFDDMALPDALKESLKAVGYLSPTPIQAALIPEALKGIDIIGQAKTGTGKTASFLLPAFTRIEGATAPAALVLCPTRELVQQVVDEGRKICGIDSIRIAAVYGGTHMQRQIAEVQRGAQLIVGTPGRLLDLMRRGALRTSQMAYVVLDEADRMLDIGFRPDIERILRSTPEQRQTLLLSATMPPPVARLARRYMRDPITINLSTDELSVDTIDQKYFTVDEDRKLELLLRLLVREKPRQALIFCQTKVGVGWLAAQLGRRIRDVMAMRGDMPQQTRSRVMRDFREGKVRVLVATDVVGRGIDVTGISHVINYDIPEDPEAYVHRVGRTGRMGKDGTAFTLVTPQQGHLLTTVEIFINKQLGRDRIEGFVHCVRREPEVQPERDPAVDAPDDDAGPRMGRDGRPVAATRYRRAL